MTLRPLIALALALAALAACGPRPVESEHLTDDEQRLVERITRDPFIVVVDRRRNDDGYLIVTTRQGDTRVRYLLAPDTPASKELKIRRMVEDFALKVGDSDQLGTGAPSRGLTQ